MVGKSFWTPSSFVMNCILRRISLKSPSAATNICPHVAGVLLHQVQNWISQQDSCNASSRGDPAAAPPPLLVKDVSCGHITAFTSPQAGKRCFISSIQNPNCHCRVCKARRPPVVMSDVTPHRNPHRPPWKYGSELGARPFRVILRGGKPNYFYCTAIIRF